MKFYSYILSILSAAYGPDEMGQFVGGLYDGLLKVDDADKIIKCLKDNTTSANDL